MGYNIDFKDVLLPEWQAWDGDGVSDIPGKDVTLKDGTKGSILINSVVIGVYNTTLNELYEAYMGTVFLRHIEKVEDKDQLETYLSDTDLDEAIIVYEKFMKREDSFVSKLNH